ncbi:MAG: CoA-binding protein [Paracoccaceae bacterium]|nr:CoA-binding protein [Paracoccaceae bacterium]
MPDITENDLPDYSDAELRAILTRTRTIAAVGVSLNDVRPSFFVARYLKTKGFRVIPVNPAYAGQEAFGETIHASLSGIPQEVGPIDMVDIFRRSELAGAVVDEAIEALGPRGLKTVWMQIGVADPVAAKRAEKAGLTVIMNRCPKIEYQRLWGELRWGGINTGIISSKLGG